MSIENFSWVLAGKLAGMAEPTGLHTGSDKHVVSDLEELFRRGIRCILSVKPMDSGFGGLCSRASLKWLYYPVENFSVPENPLEFHRVLTETLSEMERGNPVCVHCYAGIGRTGLVLSCLVGRFLRVSPNEAIQLVRQARESFDTDEQIFFAREYLRAVQRQV